MVECGASDMGPEVAGRLVELWRLEIGIVVSGNINREED